MGMDVYPVQTRVVYEGPGPVPEVGPKRTLPITRPEAKKDADSEQLVLDYAAQQIVSSEVSQE